MIRRGLGPDRPFSLLATLGLMVGMLTIAPPALAAPSTLSYIAVLDGASESPPVDSPGSGFARVDLDVDNHTMRVRIEFAGLTAPTTVAHIHGPTAVPGAGTASVATMVPTFAGFPAGVSSGTYDHTFDTSEVGTWSPAFLGANGGTAAGAEAALASSLAAGTAYLNVHSTAFPGGEIRGFLLAETDGDGVLDATDRCPGTTLPDVFPQYQANRYRADEDGTLTSGLNNAPSYTIGQTGGCSATQIIEQRGLGKGHLKHGLARGVLEAWIE